MRHIIGAVCGLLIIALAACQPNSPTGPATATLVGAFVPTRIATETATSTVTATPTATDTATNTPTITSTPTSTETLTFTPSSTPTQTLTRTPTATPITPTATPETPTATSDGITRIQVGIGPTPIPASENGFSFEGEISDDVPRVHFILEGEEGEVIGAQLQVSAGDLDPYLIITNAAGEVITENDDDQFGLGRDSYIRDFELPQTGRYFIIATRFEQEDGDTEGDFVFTLERSGDDTVVATTEATADTGDAIAITCDQTIPSTIDSENYAWRFSFEAEEGQMVGLQMVATSGDLDSIVRLLNADGDVLRENDDDPFGFGKDAYLRDAEIPETGTYLIETTRFQDDLGTTEGDFEVTLVCTDQES